MSAAPDRCSSRNPFARFGLNGRKALAASGSSYSEPASKPSIRQEPKFGKENSTAASSHPPVSAFESSQIQAQPVVSNTTVGNVLSGSPTASNATPTKSASNGNSETTVTLTSPTPRSYLSSQHLPTTTELFTCAADEGKMCFGGSVAGDSTAGVCQVPHSNRGVRFTLTPKLSPTSIVGVTATAQPAPLPGLAISPFSGLGLPSEVFTAPALAPDAAAVPDVLMKPLFVHTPYDGACRLFVKGMEDRGYERAVKKPGPHRLPAAPCRLTARPQTSPRTRLRKLFIGGKRLAFDDSAVSPGVICCVH